MQNRERKIIKFVSLGIVVAIFVLFSLYQSRNIILGPKVTITKPQDGETMNESLTMIVGDTRNISEIKLNGRNIFVNEKGEFEEKILLSYGYNTVTLEAKDRFNRTTLKKLELVLK
jgi:hypothetical protein